WSSDVCSSDLTNPSSQAALSRPAAAESLKDWSPRPPTSKAMPTLTSPFSTQSSEPLAESSVLFLAQPAPANTRAATVATAVSLFNRRTFPPQGAAPGHEGARDVVMRLGPDRGPVSDSVASEWKFHPTVIKTPAPAANA